MVSSLDGQGSTPAPQAGNIPVLHRILLIGLVAISAVMLFLRYRGVSTPDLSLEATAILTYAFVGCSIMGPMVALTVFKPRVPIRRSDQSTSQYWSTPEVASNVMLIWLLVEGGGTVAAVGYFLTGSPILAIAMGLIVALFLGLGPNRFANG